MPAASVSHQEVQALSHATTEPVPRHTSRGDPSGRPAALYAFFGSDEYHLQTETRLISIENYFFCLYNESKSQPASINRCQCWLGVVGSARHATDTARSVMRTEVVTLLVSPTLSIKLTYICLSSIYFA